MIVIINSLRSATPLREAWGMYTVGYTFIFGAIETVGVRVGRLPTPTDSVGFMYATPWLAVKTARSQKPP